MAWKKENEVYFGDTFNRQSVDACYLNNVTACNATTDSWTMAKGVTSHAEGVGTVATGLASVGTAWGSLDKLIDDVELLRQQVAALQQVPKATSKLRSALKTLNYKKELE